MRTREIGEDRKILVKNFHNVEEFWSYFWDYAGNLSPKYIYKEFIELGCYNWVLDFPETGYFEELLYRLKAAEVLHVKAYDNFDEAPADEMELLLFAHGQIEQARDSKQADEIKRQREKVTHGQR